MVPGGGVIGGGSENAIGESMLDSGRACRGSYDVRVSSLSGRGLWYVGVALIDGSKESHEVEDESRECCESWEEEEEEEGATNRAKVEREMLALRDVLGLSFVGVISLGPANSSGMAIDPPPTTSASGMFSPSVRVTLASWRRRISLSLSGAKVGVSGGLFPDDAFTEPSASCADDCVCV